MAETVFPPAKPAQEASMTFEDKVLMAQIEAAERPVDHQALEEGALSHCRDEALVERAERERIAQELMPKLYALRDGPDDARSVEQILDSIPQKRAELQAAAAWLPFQTAKMVCTAIIGGLGFLVEVPVIGPIILNPLRGQDETMEFFDWVLATGTIVALVGTFAVALHLMLNLLDDRLRRIVKLCLGLTAIWLLTQAPYLSAETSNALAEALGRAEPHAPHEGSKFFRSMAAFLNAGVAALMFDSAWRGYREKAACSQAAVESEELGQLHAKGKQLLREHEREAESTLERMNKAIKWGYVLIQEAFSQRASGLTAALRDTLKLQPGRAPLDFPEDSDAPGWIKALASSVMPPAIDPGTLRRNEISEPVLERLSDHALYLIQRSDDMRQRAIKITHSNTKKELEAHA